MSRFLGRGKLTEKQQKALNALRELLAEGGDDSVTRIYAEAIAEHREAEYAKHHGLKISSVRRRCLCHFLGKRCPYAIGKGCIYLDGVDHASLLNRDGKPSVFVSQPYYLNLETMRSIVTSADKYALDIEVTAGSWYFPGEALLMTVRHKEQYGEKDSDADSQM